MDVHFKLFIIGFLANVVLAEDTCVTAAGSVDCEYGCCSASNGLDKCCNLRPIVVAASGVFYTILLFLILLCCYCKCYRKKGNAGHEIQPQEQPSISTDVVLAEETCVTAAGSVECVYGCCSASNGLDKCCNLRPVVAAAGGVFYTILMFLILLCCYCKCCRKKGNAGHVTQPQEQPSISTVNDQNRPVYGISSSLQPSQPSYRPTA